MSSRRKSVIRALLAMGVFLLATVSPTALMLCKMAVEGCPARCAASMQMETSQGSSFEADCATDCCLTLKRSQPPAIASESRNVSDVKANHLVLFAFQSSLLSQSESVQSFKLFSPHYFHPPAPEVFLLKSSFLI